MELAIINGTYRDSSTKAAAATGNLRSVFRGRLSLDFLPSVFPLKPVSKKVAAAVASSLHCFIS